MSCKNAIFNDDQLLQGAAGDGVLGKTPDHDLLGVRSHLEADRAYAIEVLAKIRAMIKATGKVCLGDPPSPRECRTMTEPTDPPPYYLTGLAQP
jgi:hypothetical protein